MDARFISGKDARFISTTQAAAVSNRQLPVPRPAPNAGALQG